MHPSRTRQDLPRAQLLAERAFATLERFLHIEALSGVVLLIAAAIALLWANSPLAPSYHALWHAPVSFGVGSFVFSQTLHFFYCKCFLARIRKVFEQLILIHTIDRTGIRHLTF